MNKSRFLVVCGMPRSGTRQFSDYLNSVSVCSIQGEINEKIIPHIYSVLKSADDAYMGSKHEGVWLEKRPGTVFSLFSDFQKLKKFPSKKDCQMVGFKTPGIEIRYNYIKKIVGESFSQTVWFYCIRDFIDCYLSLRSMPWFNRGASQFVDKYIRSLSAAVRILDEGVHNNASFIYPLNLSDYVVSEDKVLWVKDNIYSKIDVDISYNDIEGIILKAVNRNSGENRFGVVEKPKMSNEDIQVFEKRKQEINDMVNIFNVKFGQTLKGV